MIRVAIRGFAGGLKQFEDRVLIDAEDLGALLPSLAEKHKRILAAHKLQMIEIEFLDELNPNERFYRFGTDPSGMVMPVIRPKCPGLN